METCILDISFKLKRTNSTIILLYTNTTQPTTKQQNINNALKMKNQL